MTIAEALALAWRHHQSGNPAQAEHIYRRILQTNPRQADALHLLGMLAAQQGRTDVGIDYMLQALAINPSNPLYHSNLGLTYQKLGRHAEAEACFRQAVQLKQDFADAHFHLGNTLKAEQRLDEAIASYRRTIECNPDYADAHNNLGVLLADQENYEEAKRCYDRTLQLRPVFATAHFNRANTYRKLGRIDDAVAGYQEAIRLQPDLTEAHYFLAAALDKQGNYEAMWASLNEALRLKPDYAEVHNAIGVALWEQGDFENAVQRYRVALQLKPDLIEAHNNLGTALKDMGQIEAAIACYRQVLAIDPGYDPAHSNLLFTMHYSSSYDPATIFTEHVGWGERHQGRQGDKETRRQGDGRRTSPTRSLTTHHSPLTTHQRLRIGYVSPDFHEHPIARLIEPILVAHDRNQFEVFCYSNVPRPDEMTKRLQRHADQWRSLVDLNDDQAADLIRRDEIDILIDLAGHTAHHRLLVFARKPAPIQVTHFGYPNTTGLSAIDYRITDAYADPPGMTESLHTEMLFRLPDVAWCYQPTLAPDISPLPALQSGGLTFGSFNSWPKITPDVIALWCRMLKALPAARLLLLNNTSGNFNQCTLDVFARHGIDPERLEIAGRCPRQAYLELIQRVDICLDPFPYNGGVTTCDALWMGVPVISLEGDSYVSRQGVSLLSNVGLEEWIAGSPDDYLAIAVRWSADLDRLARLRSELRPRMKASPITDGVRFTRNLEAAYHEMWRRHITV